MSLSVTGLSVGQTATISVQSSSRIGQSVVVNLKGALGQTDSVSVTIGPGGTGSANWVVPDWGTVNLKDGVCDEITRVIEVAVGGEG